MCFSIHCLLASRWLNGQKALGRVDVTAHAKGGVTLVDALCCLSSCRWLVLQGVISHRAPHNPLPRNIPMETITHPTLVQLVAAGAVRVVVAVGQPGGWTLLVRYGLVNRPLALRSSSSGVP